METSEFEKGSSGGDRSDSKPAASRRAFLAAAGTLGVGVAMRAYAEDLPVVSAGSSPGGPVLVEPPVVSGPSPDAMTLLQPVARHATGFVEIAIGSGKFERIDAEIAGLLPFEQHVLKFRLPPLPEGTEVRCRVTARAVGWVPVREFVHGKIVTGEPETKEIAFRTLDSRAETTSFVVWNDTHENEQTLLGLGRTTPRFDPDFLLWNGDQTNDIHDPADMARQLLAPLRSNANCPLAYVRGNHDVRGPAARHLTRFTGTPGDRFYYGFRSGPVAALVLDTGEDKADDHPNFAGLAAFQPMRERQAKWLSAVTKEPWFQSAPIRIAFCHLPLWWIRDRKDIDWWEFSKVSRDAWLPALTEAGVKVVISGHTHEWVWMPAKEDQPIAQLIGGGPHPNFATLIHGTATRNRLALEVRRATDGSLLREVEIEA